MQLDGFGEAERFAREPLDTRAQRQRLAFNLLRIAFARDRSVRSQMPCVRPPVVGEEAGDPKGFQQGLELQEPLVSAPPKDIGQDLPGLVIKGMPEPARLRLLTHKTPHFVYFGFVHALEDDLNLPRG